MYRRTEHRIPAHMIGASPTLYIPASEAMARPECGGRDHEAYLDTNYQEFFCKHCEEFMGAAN